jgi:hypothetical protein
MAIEALPKGLTQDDVMKLITHPSFRAAVERQVHAKLVQLGVSQPGPLVAVDEKGEPLPGQPKMVPVMALVPKQEPVEKLTAKQAHAKAMGWVATKEVLRVLGVTGAYVIHLVKRGLLRGAAHGYYTAESLEKTRQYMMENGIGTEGHAQKMREAVAKLRGAMPALPHGHQTLQDAAKQYGKSRSTMSIIVRKHKVPTVLLPWGNTGTGLVAVDTAALAALMATYKGHDYGGRGHVAKSEPQKQVERSTEVPAGFVSIRVLADELGWKHKDMSNFVSNRKLPAVVVPGVYPKGVRMVDRAAFEAELQRRPRSARKPACR